MVIRDYEASDSREIANLFHDSVHAISTEIYSKEQLEAWSPSPPDYAYWRSKLESSKPFVSTIDATIVGFIELEDDGHIDCLYVHKDYQGQGVAGELLAYAFTVAISHGISDLTVEASEVARPFFEKHGFVLLGKNVVDRNGQRLVNFSMRRKAAI